MLQPKLINLALLSSNNWFNDFDATRFQKTVKIFLNIFVFLVPVKILSYYPNNDSSNWLREDLQWIEYNFFKQKFIVLMASTLSSRTFLLNFLFLNVFDVLFIVKSLFVMSYWLPKREKRPFSAIEA